MTSTFDVTTPAHDLPGLVGDAADRVRARVVAGEEGGGGLGVVGGHHADEAAAPC